jgi:hypothetical protein
MFQSITIAMARVAFVVGLCCGLLTLAFYFTTGATELLLFAALGIASSGYAFNVSKRRPDYSLKAEDLRRLVGVAA